MEATSKLELEYIPIKDIQPDPNQPRKYFDEQALQELAESIRIHGVLQPILVRRDEKGQIIIVSGERRYKASELAEKDMVPVIFTLGKPGEIALVENLLREDLTAIEEAEAMKRVMAEYNYSQEDLSRVVGKAPSTISEILKLNNLPKEIRDECRGNPKVSRRVLVEIAKKPTAKGMMSLYKKYKERGLTREEIRFQIARPRKETLAKFSKNVDTFKKALKNLKMSNLQDQSWQHLKSLLNDLSKFINGRIKQIEAEMKKGEEPKRHN